MPRHLISEAQEWISKIHTVPGLGRPKRPYLKFKREILAPDIVWVHSQLCDIIGDDPLQLGHVPIHGDVAHLIHRNHLKESEKRGNFFKAKYSESVRQLLASLLKVTHFHVSLLRAAKHDI